MNGTIRILCVDDERNVLRALERIFLDDDFEILTAPSGEEGLELLESGDTVQIVVSDYRMPGMNGVDFLSEVCRRWPDTVRIVLSGYADTAAVVAAINEGQIYKFIAKPWNDDELKVTITNAIERYFLNKRNQELTEELRQKNEELNLVNQNLERLVAEKTSKVMFQNKILLASQNILDALPIGVVGSDSNGLVVQCNHLAAELLGVAQEGLIGAERLLSLPAAINGFIDGCTGPKARQEVVELNSARIRLKGAPMLREDQEGIIVMMEREG